MAYTYSTLTPVTLNTSTQACAREKNGQWYESQTLCDNGLYNENEKSTHIMKNNGEDVSSHLAPCNEENEGKKSVRGECVELTPERSRPLKPLKQTVHSPRQNRKKDRVKKKEKKNKKMAHF